MIKLTKKIYRNLFALLRKGLWKGFLFLLFLLLFGEAGRGFAQDIHLSQFNSCPQNLNPSQTGMFNGDWRFVGNYRTQWAGISVPFVSYSIAADTRLRTKLKSATTQSVKLCLDFKMTNSTVALVWLFYSAGNTGTKTGYVG